MQSNPVSLIQYDQFKFVVLPGANPDVQHLDYYNDAYQCWLNVWEEAYKEIGYSKSMHSDEFTRQAYVNCIFYNSKCVAIMFLRNVDISLLSGQHDSYFRLWNPDDLTALAKDGHNILVMSNMTIDMEWRKKNIPISLKDLIVYYCCRRFLESENDSMATFTRNTKNVNALAERFGGTCIRENIANYNNVDMVNLYAFRKETTTHGTHEDVKKLGDSMWNNILIVERMSDKIIPSSTPPKKQAA